MNINSNLAILTSLLSLFSSSCGSDQTEFIENSDYIELTQEYAEKCISISESSDEEASPQSECSESKNQDEIDYLESLLRDYWLDAKSPVAE